MSRTRTLAVAVSATTALLLTGMVTPASSAEAPFSGPDSLSGTSERPQPRKAGPSTAFGATSDGFQDEFYCDPKVVSTKVTPRAASIGVSAAKYMTFRVGLYDPCFYAEYLAVFGERSPEVYFDGYAYWENDGEVDANGVAYATYEIELDPYALNNSLAGTWTWGVNAQDEYYDYVADGYGPNFYLQRASTLTTNAAPEPVKKGQTITVTGALKRANWDTLKYSGYSGQTVVLQQRTMTGAYKDVKSVLTNSSGVPTAKVTAVNDACFRYVYKGRTTTPAVTSAGDCVDVV